MLRLLLIICVIFTGNLLANSSMPSYCPKEELTIFDSASNHPTSQCIDQWQYDVLSRTGCNIKRLKQIPHKRKLSMIKSGQLSAARGLGKLPERQKYAHFSIPYTLNEYTALAKKGSKAANIKYWCDQTMRSSTLLLQAGVHIGPKVDGESVKRCTAESIRSNWNLPTRLEMLNLEKVDFLFVSTVTWNYMLETGLHTPDNFVRLPFTMGANKVYFAFSKQNVSEEFVAKFNTILEQELPNKQSICHFPVTGMH